MTNVKVDVKWFGNDLLAEIQGGSDDALFEAAQQILDVAISKAPERTGNLKASGYVKTSKRSTYSKRPGSLKEREVSEGVALAGFSIFYAHMVERGTSKMRARPFLRPAMDSAKDAAGEKFVIVMRGKVKGRR